MQWAGLEAGTSVIGVSYGFSFLGFSFLIWEMGTDHCTYLTGLLWELGELSCNDQHTGCAGPRLGSGDFS